MKQNTISIASLIVATVSLIWVAYLHFGRTALVLDRLRVETLSAGTISVEIDGQELAVLTRSSVTGGGAIALMNSKGEQTLVASDGALAMRGGDQDAQETLIENIRGWALVFAATPESSTIAMKGVDAYEVVIEAGKTLDDPLDIRGGRISVQRGSMAVQLEASGVTPAQPRNW